MPVDVVVLSSTWHVDIVVCHLAMPVDVVVLSFVDDMCCRVLSTTCHRCVLLSLCVVVVRCCCCCCGTLSLLCVVIDESVVVLELVQKYIYKNKIKTYLRPCRRRRCHPLSLYGGGRKQRKEAQGVTSVLRDIVRWKAVCGWKCHVTWSVRNQQGI